MNELMNAALTYVERGLPVIALRGKTPNGKVHRHGLDDALTNDNTTGEFATAFEHPLTTGVGIVIPYPYVVVDIDSEAGAQNWKALAGDQYMPDRWVAQTAHGLHLWFASIEPTGSFKPFGKDGGVDLKGQHSYVAVEPSWHPGYPDEGIEPGPLYTWLLPPADNAPMDAPDALCEAIRSHNFEVARAVVGRSQRRVKRHEPFDGLPFSMNATLWASVGFDHLIEGMASAGPGNRNNYLHWAAATMAEEGASDEEFEALRLTARTAGLLAVETRRTILSARANRG